MTFCLVTDLLEQGYRSVSVVFGRIITATSCCSHFLYLFFFDIPFFRLLYYRPALKNISFTRNYQNNLFAGVLNPPSEKRKENNDAHRKHSLLLFSTNAFYCNTQHVVYIPTCPHTYHYICFSDEIRLCKLLILITIEAASHANSF